MVRFESHTPTPLYVQMWDSLICSNSLSHFLSFLSSFFHHFFSSISWSSCFGFTKLPILSLFIIIYILFIYLSLFFMTRSMIIWGLSVEKKWCNHWVIIYIKQPCIYDAISKWWCYISPNIQLNLKLSSFTLGLITFHMLFHLISFF